MAASKKKATDGRKPAHPAPRQELEDILPQFADAERPVDPIAEAMKGELPLSSSETYIPSAVHRTLSTSPLVSSIFKDLKVSLPNELPLSTREATAKVVVDTKSVILGKEFNEFDRSVLEAVLAQLAAGNLAMTSAMIFRALAGKNAGFSGSDDMLSSIDESMTKCMYTPVVLPLRFDEATGKMTDFSDGAVIPANRRTRNICGKMVSTYELNTIPLIYLYCRAQNAVTFAPIEMVAVPISATKRSLAILNFLQRTVTPYIFTPNGENMIRSGGRAIPDVVVLYDSLYALASAQDPEKNRASLEAHGEDSPKKAQKYSWFLKDKTRETVASILDHWHGLGLIDSWENQTKGRAIYSVTIHFCPVDEKYLPLPTPENPVSAL